VQIWCLQASPQFSLIFSPTWLNGPIRDPEKGAVKIRWVLAPMKRMECEYVGIKKVWEIEFPFLPKRRMDPGAAVNHLPEDEKLHQIYRLLRDLHAQQEKNQEDIVKLETLFTNINQLVLPNSCML